mmetsp:Transcript_62492/g.132064  ORF Transcript_62492/g.132064 Transcript_62492/m.132064 type:complete len:282 (-) Transcript_62492:438-1283(-)
MVREGNQTAIFIPFVSNTNCCNVLDGLSSQSRACSTQVKLQLVARWGNNSNSISTGICGSWPRLERSCQRIPGVVDRSCHRSGLTLELLRLCLDWLELDRCAPVWLSQHETAQSGVPVDWFHPSKVDVEIVGDHNLATIAAARKGPRDEGGMARPSYFHQLRLPWKRWQFCIVCHDWHQLRHASHILANGDVHARSNGILLCRFLQKDVRNEPAADLLIEELQVQEHATDPQEHKQPDGGPKDISRQAARLNPLVACHDSIIFRNQSGCSVRGAGGMVWTI